MTTPPIDVPAILAKYPGLKVAALRADMTVPDALLDYDLAQQREAAEAAKRAKRLANPKPTKAQEAVLRKMAAGWVIAWAKSTGHPYVATPDHKEYIRISHATLAELKEWQLVGFVDKRLVLSDSALAWLAKHQEGKAVER